jgi:hypothetical protein
VPPLLLLPGGWHQERDEHEHNGVVHAEGHQDIMGAARADLLLPAVPA